MAAEIGCGEGHARDQLVAASMRPRRMAAEIADELELWVEALKASMRPRRMAAEIRRGAGLDVASGRASMRPRRMAAEITLPVGASM